MTPDIQQLMNEVTRLTRAGNLHAATAAIQAAFASDGRAKPGAGDRVLDVESREIAQQDAVHAETGRKALRAENAVRGQFIAGSHGATAGRRDYKLYIPPNAGARALPLVVMLHGCTQNPDDFAAGTAMNEAAQAQGFYVLYPAQSQQANPQRCWNWFKHSHQQRGRGEPALLAGMTRQVMAQHAIDPQRIYVAGLSAGGAMAAILGNTYQDLFCAVGVHSGLAAGVASDLPSALAAMRGAAGHAGAAANGTPTIVFHGDADTTVHPSNAELVIAACVGDTSSVEIQKLGDTADRACTRRVHRGSDGRVMAEHWLVQGGPHAWSGGSAKGSYTDSRGPDASAQMLRFFFAHPRRPAH
jgi:poly(hydroxyalkanoate) depolymerase family esterase